MKFVLSLVALGLLQACSSLPTGKKMDQGGRFLQGSLSGAVYAQVDFPSAQGCSADLRVGPAQQNDLTCSLTSAASTLPFKGTMTNKVIGEVSPLHFKGESGCSVYKETIAGITDKAFVSCGN